MEKDFDNWNKLKKLINGKEVGNEFLMCVADDCDPCDYEANG